MTELARFEARLSSVERTLSEIEGRVRRLEGASPPQPVRLPAAASDGPRVATAGTDLVGTLTLIGRTFVILAGAYLLRALTESGLLDRVTGAALGFAYAAAWTVVAYRVAPRNRTSATFFAACTILIAFPLLWEAVTRFAVLTPASGALALAATTVLVLVTAWRRWLHVLAWVTTLSACVLASLLLVATGSPLAFVTFLVVLGVATLWLGYDREWTTLRWVAALVADIAVVLLVARALTTPPRDAPSLVMAVQVLLLVGYLASIAIRTLVRGRDVLLFEAAQTGAMLLTGLAGALLIALRTGTGAMWLGPALLVLAFGCYAVAMAFVDRRPGPSANFYFYTSLALVFALSGSELLLGTPALALVWTSFGVLAGRVGRRYGRVTLGAHAVVYLAAAAVSSGLMAAAFAGLFASAATPWASVGGPAWGVLAAIGICWLLSSPEPGRLPGQAMGIARLALAVLAALGLAGVGVTVGRLMLPASALPQLQAGMIATMRTGVLAGAALLLAWLGRRPATREFGALLYPALVWGGLKLVVEDFRSSPPSLLVVALALYGGTLILGPRIAKARERSSPEHRQGAQGMGAQTTEREQDEPPVKSLVGPG